MNPTPDAETVAPPRFGDAGQVVLSSGLLLDFGHQSRSDSDASSFSFTVRPGADVFVWKNFSVGGYLQFGHASTSTPYVFSGVSSFTVDSSTVTYGIGGRIGFNVPMGEWVSFWPRVAVGLWTQGLTESEIPYGYSSSRDGVTLPTGDYRETAMWIDVYAPFLFHPTAHFFVGFGPEFFVDVVHDIGSEKSRRTNWGATSLLGGWF